MSATSEPTEPRRNPERIGRPTTFREYGERMRSVSATRQAEVPNLIEIESAEDVVLPPPTTTRTNRIMPGALPGMGNDTTIIHEPSIREEITTLGEENPSQEPNTQPERIRPQIIIPNMSRVTIQDVTEGDTTFVRHPLANIPVRRSRDSVYGSSRASSRASSHRSSQGPHSEEHTQDYSRRMVQYDHEGFVSAVRTSNPPLPIPTQVPRIRLTEAPRREAPIGQITAPLPELPAVANYLALQMNDVRQDTLKTAASLSRIEDNTNRQSVHNISESHKLDNLRGLTQETLQAAQGALTNSYTTYTTVDTLSTQLQGAIVTEIPRILGEIIDSIREIQNTQTTQSQLLINLGSDTKGLDSDLSTVIELIQGIQVQDKSRPSSPALTEQSSTGWEPPSAPPRTSTPIRKRTKIDIPKEARLKKPSRFDGKRGTAKPYLLQMELYFQDYEDAFQDDTRKVTALLSNMAEGEPTRWAEPYLRKVVEKKPDDALNSWDNLKKVVLLSFGDPLEKETATRELAKLRQTKSASEYANQFRSIKERLDWDDSALIARFKEGLKPDVKQELAKLRIHKDVDSMTLDEIIDWVIRADDILFQSRISSQGEDRTFNRNRNQKDQPNKERDHQEGRTYIPKDAFTKRRSEGRCLRCGKKGHQMAKCPEKEYLPDPEKGKKGATEDEQVATPVQSEN